ncbi:MAG: VOC family protein [Planctomycetota bacterium]
MNHFVWADLSTYNTQRSRDFYSRVFDWEFADADGYFVAYQGDSEVVGLFETPAFFQQIKMPHFWMSYIAVEDAQKTADQANAIANAKVEMVDDFYGGRVALIRDPQGAGFTVYDGQKLDSRCQRENHLIWNELHVSDASTVIPFYETLFRWNIRQSEQTNHYQIFDENKKHISDIAVIPNRIKGNYEYWACSFGVNDLQTTKQRIEQNGGGVITEERDRVLMHDDSAEAFFYISQL